MHATDADVTFNDGPGMHTVKAAKRVYNSTWIALLKHGFVLVKTWLLIACGTDFYAIIDFKCTVLISNSMVAAKKTISLKPLCSNSHEALPDEIT